MATNKKNRSARNHFTDALNEELSTRRIIDKTNRAGLDESVFLTEVKEPEPPPPPAPKTPAPKKKPKPKPKPKKSVAKPKPPKVETPAPKVDPPKVEPDPDFEQRVFAEAENDFYDEKPAGSAGKNIHSELVPTEEVVEPRKKTFYGRRSVEPDPEPEPPTKTEDEPVRRKLTRAEVSGLAISGVMMIYAFVTQDTPLFFLSLSLLSYLIRPFAVVFGGHAHDVQNGLRGFSIALFFGSILMLFF